MTAASWAIPTGVLGGLVLVCLLFIWWWFPRTWQRGINSDRREVQARGGGDREARRAANRAIIERYTRSVAREKGEEMHDVERGGEAEEVVYRVEK